jgi:hypothetical protein
MLLRIVGTEIPNRDAQWDEHHREVPSGGAVALDLDSTAFAQRWCREWTGGRRGPVIGFRVRSRDTVDRLYAELTSPGYRGLQISVFCSVAVPVL